MEKSIITSGKTIDLAVEAALAQLGLDRDSVSVTVLSQAKSGFLGFGAQPAKVQVTYEAPDLAPAKPEAPKSALGSASRSKPRKPAAPVKTPETPKPEVKPEANPEVKPEVKPEPQPQAPAPKAAPAKQERTARPERKAEPAKAPKERREPKEPKVKEPPKEYAPAAPGSVEEKIEVFLKGLLEHMNSTAVPHCWKEVLPRVAVCAAVQGFYNLLPIEPLDGGRALRLCLEHWCPHRAEKIMTLVRFAILGGIVAAAYGISYCNSGGFGVQ